MLIPQHSTITKVIQFAILALLVAGILVGCSGKSSPPLESQSAQGGVGEATRKSTLVVKTKTYQQEKSSIGTDEPTTKPDPTNTPAPSPTPTPEDWQDYPVIPDISPRAIEIYQRGIEMGNDPHRFSKIGDCQNISTYFLAMFENPELHSLGEEYSYLQEVIDWYWGSYSRESLAVAGGLNVARVLSPFHADVNKCEPNENSLSCEVRIFNPSIAIVSLEENWSSRTAEEYEEHLRTIIEFLIEGGVLPVLVTKADNVEGDHSINTTIVKLAGEYEIPLWNFWLAVQPLPNHGLKKDGFHLTLAGPYFDSKWHMKAGWVWRNLTALQTLDAVWRTANEP